MGMEEKKANERRKTRRKIIHRLTADFRIRLLGPPEILMGGRMAKGRLLDRPLALFVYLAASGGAVARPHLTRIFWGGLTEKEASSALSRTLYELERRGLGPLLEKSPSVVRFLPPRGMHSFFDILDFTDDSPPPYCRHLHHPAECAGCAQKMAHRLSLVRGPFLEGVELPPDCPLFESWILERRLLYEEMAERLRPLLSAPPRRDSPRRDIPEARHLPRALPSGERRKMVVLAILPTYHPALSPQERLLLSQRLREGSEEILRRHGGWVPPRSTAGIQGYFGFPGALEFAPRLAANSAREILDSRRAFLLPAEHGTKAPALTLRLGIWEGISMSDIAGGVPDITGELTTAAIALAQAAPEGSIAVAPALFPHLTSTFLVKERISRPSPDGASSLELHILGPRRPTPLAPSIGEGLSLSSPPPLIGRSKELRLISSLWRKVERGGKKMIVVTGEAGIGKSRLLAEFLEKIQSEDPGTIIRRLACHPEDREIPWAPVRWLFRGILGLGANLSPADTVLRTESYLASLGKSSPEETALFLQFIEGEGPWSDRLTDHTPAIIRQKIEKLVEELVFTRSQQTPLVLLFEDIQWADSATLSLLKASVMATEASRILVLLSSRDDQIPSRHRLSPDGTIPLAPLSPRKGRELLGHVLPPEASFSHSQQMRLVQRSGGNPFYLLELVRASALGEEGGALGATLDTQIDALGEASHTLGMAACLGLRFSRNILVRIVGPARFRRHELPLFRRGLLTSSPEDPHILEFRHALIRDHILERLTPEILRPMHRKIARTLSALFEGSPEASPEIVARHYASAGDPGQAIPLYRLAAERALALGATSEGWNSLEKALSLLPPGDPARLPILVAMGPVAAILFGYAHEHYLRVYQEARTLLQESGITRSNLPVWNGLRATLIGREGPHAARETARDIRVFSEAEGSDEERLRARYAQGNIAYYGGQMEECEGYLREAVALLPLVGERSPGASLGPYAEDPGVTALSYLGAVRLLRGYAGEARLWQEQANGRALRIGQVNSLCHAKTMEIFGLLFSRQRELTRQAAEDLERIARERGYPQWLAFARLFGAWARGGREDLAASGSSRELLEKILPGLAPLFLSIEAETLLFAGRTEAAAEKASLAFVLSEKTGTALVTGRVLQLRGEARLRESPGDPEAKTDFVRALNASRGGQNALFALQAAIALQRHFPEEPEQLRQALSAVTDGESLPAVLEARALLSDRRADP